jgi:hypothetical protein
LYPAGAVPAQVVASNEVLIHSEIQLIKQAAPVSANEKQSEKAATV